MKANGWTLHTIAIRANIGYTTLRRICKGETEEPKFNTIEAILDVVATASAKAEFISCHFPKESKYHHPFTTGGTKEPISLDPDVDHYLRITPHCALLILATTPIGISKETAFKISGEAGPKAIDEMEKANLLTLDDNVYRSPPLKFSLIETLELIKNHSSSSFKLETLGILSRVYFSGMSLNDRGKDQLANVLASFIGQCSAIRNDPSLEGNFAMFIGLISSPYFFDKE